LKKQKAGGGAKKAGAKKKEDKAESSAAATAEKQEEPDADAKAGEEEKEDTTPAADGASPDAEGKKEDRPPHNRQASLSLQSKMRSEAFRGTGSLASPLSPSDEAQEIYRKQAQRIEELEKANKKLTVDSQDAEARLKKSEDALESLREASGEVAELKSKADQADARGEELDKLVCPNSQLLYISLIDSRTRKQRLRP